MQKITPFLWFDKEAEEAANFYVSIFKNSKITSVSPMVVAFNLDGEDFVALNGGPQMFKFNESISFVIACEDQAEIDYFWQKLTDGGEESMCGWLKDKYGLSWQVVPKNISELLQKPGANEAMLKMKKLVIADLQTA